MLTVSAETDGQKSPGIVDIRMPHSKIALSAILEWGLNFNSSDESLLEGTPGQELLADAELGDNGFVALGIVFLEVVEQATPLADQHEKAAARAVVFLVRLEVLRQLANAFTEQRDLDFGTAGIAGMRAVLVDEGFLVLSG